MLKVSCALLVSLLVCSCANVPLNTPSGRPEVAVNSSLSKAKSATLGTMTSKGFSLTDEGPNLLTFECPMDPAQASVFLLAVGNSNYSQPMNKIRTTFMQSGKQVKIFASIQGVAQGPFGQMKTLDLTGGRTAHQVQGVLEEIKQRAE